MSLSIHLARGGKKKRPFYRVVVQERTAPRDGRFIERIGEYNPLLTEGKSSFKLDRVKHWMDVGASPSLRVYKLLSFHGFSHPALDKVAAREKISSAAREKAYALKQAAEKTAKEAEETKAEKTKKA